MGRRLFTFGCSFTRYVWPTWANILGKEFEFFENWGLAGTGNQFIFNSLVECHAKHNLTADDVVIVMWTNVYRQDGYKNSKWNQRGSLLHRGNQKLLKYYQAEINDVRGTYIRDFSLIQAAYQLLTSIGCNFQFHSMIPILTVDELFKENINSNVDITDLYNMYKQSLDFIRPSVYEVVADNDWKNMETADLSYTAEYTKLNILTSIENLKHEYNILAGVDWPEFDLYITNSRKHINEIIQKEIESYDFLNRYRSLVDQKIKTFNGVDWHPTPLEHLRYVRKAMPEFQISNSTVEWVKDCQLKVRSNNAFLFDESLPNRL